MKGLISFWVSDIENIRKLLARIQTDVERASLNPLIKRDILSDFKSVVKSLAKGKNRDRPANPKRFKAHRKQDNSVKSIT